MSSPPATAQAQGSQEDAQVDYFTTTHTTSAELSIVTEAADESSNPPTPLPKSIIPSPISKSSTPPASQPSLLSPVLPKATPKPPSATTRFLHSGHSLSDLESPSIMLQGLGPSVVKSVNSKEKDGKEKDAAVLATGVGSGSWRAFTDKEEMRLREAWERLNVVAEDEERGGKNLENDGKKEGEVVTDLDSLSDPTIIPVGLDSLFHVKLFPPSPSTPSDQLQHLLSPSFWSGPSLLVLQSKWFYAPPSSTNSTPLPSHLQKIYPVDLPLAEALENALLDVRPDADSYQYELSSALKGGIEAEEKLMRPLRLKDKKGKDEVEVIFTEKDQARLYSVGYLQLGKVGKRIWSGSKKGFAGGQVVLRGWEALQAYQNSRIATATPATSTTTSPSKPRSSSTSSSRSSSRSNSHHRAASNPTIAPSTTSFLETLKSKMGVVTTASEEVFEDDEEEEERGRVESRNTEEGLQGPREAVEEGKEQEGKSEEEEIGEVDELVLVIHGIGQGLAADLPSFDFVHACNQLRTVCTNLSATPSLSPVLQGKRAQFIPVRWRSDMTFEDERDEGGDKEEEELGNRFSLAEIEIQDSIPLIRQVVSGLLMDIPFYLSHHRERMILSVVREANRIYRLFASRNPSFAKNGKVSIIAHSLGSALTADILSKQPTWVKDLSAEEREKRAKEMFCFDTRVVVLVGSPLAFFLHLNKGQLIARKGRERTSGKDIGPDIALDRPRYGCMAADSIYNVYHVTDPVAFSLNATVDAAYSKLIKPIAIPSSNQTLLQNLSETYNRVSKLFDVSSLWSSTPASDSAPKEEEKKEEEEKGEEKEREKKGPPRVIPRRPGGVKRMPSERPNMAKEEFDKVNRAEQRFKALNPQGGIDFVLPAEGVNQYLEAISSHGAYWYDTRFAQFFLTQLFASQADLVKTGRDEIGTEA